MMMRGPDRLLLRLVLAAGLLSLGARPAEALGVVASQSQIKSFLGGKAGILVFTDDADGGKLKTIDLGDGSLTVKTLDSAGCRDPRLSLDGTRVVYGVAGKLFARKLSGGDPVQIADVGTGKSQGVGYWLREGSTDYIVYCTSTDKYTYDSGKTFKLKLKNGIDPDGAPAQIHDKAFDGGPTPDGKWIAEAYGERHAYNLDAKKEYGDFYKQDGTKEGQCCNASMAPQTAPYRMVTLVLPHDYFRSWQYDASSDRWNEYRTYTKPSGTEEWQRPEWSLHPDYFTVVAKQGGYDLYLQHAHDPSKRLLVIDGDIGNSHLYVGGATTPECSVDGECDDGDACTADECAGGQCGHDPIAGCCKDAGDCDDSNLCTTDSCGADNTCGFSAIAGCCEQDDDCKDNNPCTTDSCDGASGNCSNVASGDCCQYDTDCDDGNACTDDRCGADNACVHAPVEGCCTGDDQCDDGDACTDDRCGDNRCQSTAISGCCTGDAQCDDGSACTADRCGEDNACGHDPIAGCCKTHTDCADTNPCTTDTCDPVSGNCDNSRAEGCCQHDADCNDDDPCTVDSCDATINKCANERSASCVSAPGGNLDAGSLLQGGCSLAPDGRGGWVWLTALGLLALLWLTQRRRR